MTSWQEVCRNVIHDEVPQWDPGWLRRWRDNPKTTPMAPEMLNAKATDHQDDLLFVVEVTTIGVMTPTTLPLNRPRQKGPPFPPERVMMSRFLL